MVKKAVNNTKAPILEKTSVALTNWVGTPTSIIVHTLAFLVAFALPFFGVGLDKVLLIVTTIVSLEAIYLAIFIQMTVNRNTKSLQEVEEDIDEIQEDVEDLEEGVDDIQEDNESFEKIQIHLQQLLVDVENLQKQRHN